MRFINYNLFSVFYVSGTLTRATCTEINLILPFKFGMM